MLFDHKIYEDTIKIVAAAVSSSSDNNNLINSPDEVPKLIQAVYDKLSEINKTMKN